MHLKLLTTILYFFFCNFILAQEPRLILPVGHTSSITSAKFSPDEKKIITSSPDNTNKLWDAASGYLIGDFPADEGLFYSGQFSFDNKRILTISGKNARIWDATTAGLLMELKGHENFLNTAKFSPDGTHIVTVSIDSIIKVWGAAGKNILFSIREPSYINSAEFSPDGKRIVTTCFNGDVNIRDVSTGNIILSLIGHKDLVWYAEYSSNGNKLLTVSRDKTVKVWDAASGKLLRELSGGKYWLVSAHFSPDGRRIISSYADSTGHTLNRNRRPVKDGRPILSKTELKTTIWDIETGKHLLELKGLTNSVYFSRFSNDGKKILAITESFIACLWDAGNGDIIKSPDISSLIISSAEFSRDGNKLIAVAGGGVVQVWDLTSGNVLTSLKGHSYTTFTQFSRDRKKVLTYPGNNSINIRDAFTGDLLTVLRGHKSRIYYTRYSKSGRKIVTSAQDSTLKIWDSGNGDLLSTIRTNSPYVGVEISPEEKKLATSDYYNDKAATIWEVETGKLLLKLNGHKQGIAAMNFSYDGSKIITASYDSTAIIWNVESGEKLFELRGHTSYVHDAEFSPDDRTVLTTSLDKTVKIWDAISGKLRADLTAHTGPISSGHFSPDGKRIATASEDGTAKIWDAADGKLLHDLKEHTNLVRPAEFSPSGKMLITVSWDKTVKIWDVASGKLLSDLKGFSSNFLSADFYMDETKLLTSSDDNMIRIWDIQTAKVLYSLIGIDSTDFLIVDNHYRFDGTETARKLLYFTCGTEIIELAQVKDQLWVPNLAQRIMSGDSINAQNLSALNVCNLTPLVETIDQNATQYRFQITPRLGGLGTTIVYVNGIEVKKYSPQLLLRQNEKYQLVIDKNELKKFFVPGKENSIQVKALTARTLISSRSASITEKNTQVSVARPNLFAVFVGISDYKGEAMDLKYASKDAMDMSNALGSSAKKLLNEDGNEHVFIYKITTGAGRDKFPEKNSIRQVFAEIAAKAAPNDILLLFFAGHGVMDSEKNQFYFLTADASNNTVLGALKEVGISTDELTEWIKPQTLKAQKRILIFDACNSGQVIKEMISIGRKDQNFLAARGDDKSRQIKAIEKLNERSGMYILSASASDQKAYEIGKYNQGALTYSLLKAIKEDPGILEDRQYLNISRWFSAAEKSVNELSKETGARQQPQIVSTANFNIGVVDEEVRNKIVLPVEKLLFTRSEFRNTALRIDDLKLRPMVDKELEEHSNNSSKSQILYSPEYDGANVLAIGGDYAIKGKEIVVSIILTKGGTEIRARMEEKGELSDLRNLSKKITQSVLDWLKTH